MKDFFISYTSTDRDWAEWVAWKLEEWGYSTIVQAWDFRPGHSFVTDMHNAAMETKRTVAILSRQYMQRVFPQSEWAAALVQDPAGTCGKLLPIRVEDFAVPGLLSALTYIDLVALDERAASETLWIGIDDRRVKPSTPPPFPGKIANDNSAPVRFPGNTSKQPVAMPRGVQSSRIVYAKVPAHGLLDLRALHNPYDALSDSTASLSPCTRTATVTGFLWLPMTQYLRTSVLEPFTPSAAICTLEPRRVVEDLKRHLDPAMLSRFEYPPRKLRNEEKRALITAMGNAFDNCLGVAATFPCCLLEVGRQRPELAHQAMLDNFLLPLMQAHSHLGIPRFHVRLCHVGEKDAVVLKNAKTVAKACFPKNDATRVAFTTDCITDRILTGMARLFAWTIASFHNSGGSPWLSLLESILEQNCRGSSHLEEPRQS